MLSNDKQAFETIFYGEEFEKYPVLDPNDCKYLEYCINVNIILGVIDILGVGHQFGFGTMLRNFIELTAFDSFSSNKNLFDIHFDKVLFGDLNNYCEHLKPEERNVHKIFTNLSRDIAGFDANESLSAYEIPGILADPTKDELYFGTISKSFYYSRCEQPVFKHKDLQFCTKIWNDYIQIFLNQSQINSK